MSIDWSTLKSKLDLGGVLVSYIDDEGTEISVRSEEEFQEAIRTAKLNKNHLQLILTADESVGFANVKEDKIDKVTSELSGFTDKKKKLKCDSSNPTAKGNFCHCQSGHIPEWFTHHMKKFKKELLYELKSHITEIVRSALKRERKYLEANSNSCCDRKLEKKDKKKKKCDEYLAPTFLDQCESRALRKNSCLCSSKLGKLESKLDKKVRNKGKIDLLEKKTKQKYLYSENEKSKVLKKSCIINTVGGIQARPGSEFLLKISVENNGQVPWSSPQLVLDGCDEFLVDAPKRKILRKLQPRKTLSFEVELKAKEITGLFKLKCTMVDEDEVLGQPIVVWVEITPEASEPRESKCEVKELIDFSHDIIAKSQKKIEENIVEIEKRLQHIDLLRSSTVSKEKNSKSKVERGKCGPLERVNNEIFFKTGEMGGFGAGQKQTNLDFENSQDTYVITTRDDSPQSSKNKEDSGTNTDSEISVVSGSDENFIVVPSASDKDWPFDKEKESVAGCEGKDKHTKSTEPNFVPKATFPDITQLNSSDVDQKPEVSIAKENECRQRSNSGSSCCRTSKGKRSPTGKYNSEIKSKKLKSNKFGYHFTTENLTEAKFCKDLRGEGRRRVEGEKKKEKSGKRKVLTVDSRGRVIYAVTVNGYCLPVESLLKEEENSSWEKKETGNDEEENRSLLSQIDKATVVELLSTIVLGAAMPKIKFGAPWK